MAVREVHGRAFGEYGHLVDRKSHAAFCLDAYEGGLIGASSLDWLTTYPNDYGLHLVTQDVVGAIETRLSFSKTGLIRGVKRRSKLLGTPTYELQPAAQSTLGCIDAGLFTAEDVADVVGMGPDCAYHLIKKVEQSLIDLATAGCNDVKEWLSLAVEGPYFVIGAKGMNRYELKLPSPAVEEFQEVGVFLFKALDAMTTYLIPFHTPSSFMGVYSYDNYGYAEAYSEIKERIQSSTHEELTRYLMDTPEEEFPFETYAMGFEGDERDESHMEMVAANLMELDDLTRRTHFTLNHETGADQPAEIRELIEQVRDAISAGSPYKPVLEAVLKAFETCLPYAVNGDRAISEHEFTGSAEEGLGVFETTAVVIRGEYQYLEEEACAGFDDRVSGVCEICVKLPLERGVLPLRTVPILVKTKQCFALLSQINESLEGTPNA
ncbi:TPA: hypothetical protein ACP32N_003152 [Pseudomonas aeruginosa]